MWIAGNLAKSPRAENVDLSENWEVVRFAPMMDALFLLLLVLAEVCRITCPAYSLVLCICVVHTVSFGDVQVSENAHHSIGICSVFF